MFRGGQAEEGEVQMRRFHGADDDGSAARRWIKRWPWRDLACRRKRVKAPGASDDASRGIYYEFTLALNCVSGRLEDIDVYGSVGRGDAVYVQAYSGILRFMILI